jgi:hypothetical protein
VELEPNFVLSPSRLLLVVAARIFDDQ